MMPEIPHLSEALRQRILDAAENHVAKGQWPEQWNYAADLNEAIRDGSRIDPDLWFNPDTEEVELRPGDYEARREHALAHGWIPGKLEYP